MAYTSFANRQLYFGLFRTKEEAEREHDRRIVELCLDYAKLHRPGEHGEQPFLRCPGCDTVRSIREFMSGGKMRLRCLSCRPARVRAGVPKSLIPYRNRGIREYLGVRLSNLKSRCDKTGREFGLTLRQALGILESQGYSCPFCGRTMSHVAGGGRRHIDGAAMSFDRIRNDEGYTPRNVRFACLLCNRMRGAESVADFVRHCRLVAGRADGG